MNKLVGFLISKENSPPKIDFFDVGLKIIYLQCGKYHIFLWGIGDIALCRKDAQYALSFPFTLDLMDRNVLITVEKDNITIENDWLSSIPVFFNTEEKIISTLSNLCLKDKAIDEEGLANFCEFGYSVFEQTMFRDVKFMRHYSKLIVGDEISVKYKQDPVLHESFYTDKVNETDVIDLMKKYINKVENAFDGDIVLPTSGGNDSRLLNYLVKDKSRIKTFTYGVSQNQARSTEVIYAKKISEILGTKWCQIELSNYHDFIDEWFRMYGFSTHLHGMYHIEFYKKILSKKLLNTPTVLTGIVGDMWAESRKVTKIINSHDDLIGLGYTHGMALDCSAINFQPDNSSKKEYFRRYEKYFRNDKALAIFTIRNKLMLLSYLDQLPEYLGMPTWTPFLNHEIVKATLGVSEVRRKDRIWQSDFFASVGLNLEDMKLGGKPETSHHLDYYIAREKIFDPIKKEVIGHLVKPSKIAEINNLLNNKYNFNKFIAWCLHVPKLGGLLKRLGFKNKYLKALHEYYILKAIEKAISYDT
jgi:hypothetical protein